MAGCCTVGDMTLILADLEIPFRTHGPGRVQCFGGNRCQANFDRKRFCKRGTLDYSLVNSIMWIFDDFAHLDRTQ